MTNRVLSRPMRTRPASTLWFILAVTMITVCGPAGAQQPPGGQGGPPPDELRFSLGVGVISSPRPYVGASNQTRAIPLLELSWKRFYVQGIRAGYELVDGDRLSLDLQLRANFAGLEEDDSDFLRGMEDRQETVDGGLSLGWRLGQLELGLGAWADLLGRSDGVEVQAELTWPRFLLDRRLALFPSIGAVWQSSDFVDHVAGVRPDEATPWRPAFEGRSAVNVEGGVAALYRLTSRIRAVALVKAQRLANEYEDSPIIDDRWGYFGLLGASYSF